MRCCSCWMEESRAIIGENIARKRGGIIMKTTRHAEQRKEQRGFSTFTFDIIMSCGRDIKTGGGATKIFFGNKEHQSVVGEFKKAIQLLDKAKGGNIIIKGDRILTAFKN